MQWNIGFVNNYTTWLTRRIAVIYHTATYVGSKSCRVNHAIFTTVKVNTYPLFERLPVNWGQRILHFRDQSNNSLCAGLKFTLWRIFPPDAGLQQDQRASYLHVSSLSPFCLHSLTEPGTIRLRFLPRVYIAWEFLPETFVITDTRVSVSFGMAFNKQSDIQRYKFTSKHSTY